MKAFLFFVLFGVSSATHSAENNIVKITLQTKLETEVSVAKLVQLRTLKFSGKNHECINTANKMGSEFKKIYGWVLYVKLLCTQGDYLKNKKNTGAIASLIEAIWEDSSVLLFGASAKKLRFEVVNASLQLLEDDYKRNKKRSWKLIGQMLEAKEWLESKQKARLYKVAGELSFIESNLIQAKEYFEKSLVEEFSKGVQTRFETVIKTLDPKAIIASTSIVDVSQVESTREELEIYDRMRLGLKTGDLIAAAEDAVKLIEGYPGGKKADVAAREVLNIYLELAAKEDQKFLPLKDRVLSEMRKVDSQRQFDWAQTLFYRENYEDSLILAKNSLDRIESPPLLTKGLMLAAQSAHNLANFKVAREYYELIVKEHAGTKTAAEAIFRLGLLDYRDDKFASASARFEKFLLLEHNTDFELSSLYWLWRSQQKISEPSSVSYAKRLIAKYPLSYYGLRAQAEISSGKLVIDKVLAKNPEWSFNFTEHEGEVWQRFLILKKAGWIDEARLELATLEEPQAADGKIILAYLWSEVGDYYRATDLLSRALNQDPTLMALNTIQVAYPILYNKEVAKESARYKLPPELVLGLIRQESTFRVDIKSPAGALGLMQLMPATAKEVARDMRLKYKNLYSDLITPEFNIKLGTQYLHRRIRYFEGHVPFALASYNAGIGNVRGWLKKRSDIGGAGKLMSSTPIHELWIDELPWPETTGYIKSILRNYLIYQVLDHGELQLNEPLWDIVPKE